MNTRHAARAQIHSAFFGSAILISAMAFSILSHGATALWAQTTLAVSAAALLAASLWQATRHTTVAFPKTRMFTLLLVPLWALVSLSYSIYPYRSLHELAFWIPGGALGLYVCILLNGSSRRWVRLAWSITGFAGALAVLALATTGHQTVFGVRTYSGGIGEQLRFTFENHNKLAAYLGMTAPIGLALFRHSGFAARVVLGFLVGFQYLALTGTLSRGACLAALVAASAFFLLASRNRSLGSRWAWPLLTVVILAALLGLFAVTPPLLERFASIDDPLRRSFYVEALSVARERPLLGHGVGTYRVAHPAHQRAETASYDVEQPHNIVLNAAAEQGLVGATLLVLGMLVFFVVTLRRLRQTDAGPRQLIGLGAWCACLHVLLQSLVSQVTHPMSNAVLLCVVGTMAITAPRKRAAIRRLAVPASLLRAGAATALVLATAGAGLLGLSAVAEQLRDKATQKSAVGDADAAVQLLHRAIRLEPGDERSWLALASAHELKALLSDGAAGRNAALKRALDASDGAVRHNPLGYRGHELRGRLLLRMGHADDAVQSLAAAMTRGPMKASTHLAVLSARAGSHDPADLLALRETLKSLLTLHPDRLSTALDVCFGGGSEWEELAPAIPPTSDLLTRSAWYLTARGRLDLAATALASRYEREQTSENAVQHLKALAQAGAQETVLQWATRYAREHPKSLAIMSFAGDSALNAGDWQDAEQWFDRIVTIDPGDARAYRGIARALRRAGRHNEAIARLREASAAAADPFDLYLVLAEELLASGAETDALDVLLTADAHVSHAAERHLALGKARLNAGAYDRAVVSLKEAVAREPLNLDYRYELGAAYQKMGADILAADTWRDCLRQAPMHGPSRRALARLRGPSAP